MTSNNTRSADVFRNRHVPLSRPFSLALRFLAKPSVFSNASEFLGAKNLILTGLAITAIQRDALAETVNAARIKRQIPAIYIVQVHGDKTKITVTGTTAGPNPRPVQPTDRVRLGSYSRAFTVLFLTRLAYEGKVDLGRRITEFFPNVKPRNPNWDNLTLRQLLNKSVRVDRPYKPMPTPLPYESKAEWAKRVRISFTEDILAGKELAPRGPVPLTMVVAAIENSLNKPFDELIEEHFFSPLGIENAGYGAPGPEHPWNQIRTADAIASMRYRSPDTPGNVSPIEEPITGAFSDLNGFAAFLNQAIKIVRGNSEYLPGVYARSVITQADQHALAYGYVWAQSKLVYNGKSYPWDLYSTLTLADTDLMVLARLFPSSQYAYAILQTTSDYRIIDQFADPLSPIGGSWNPSLFRDFQ